MPMALPGRLDNPYQPAHIRAAPERAAGG